MSAAAAQPPPPTVLDFAKRHRDRGWRPFPLDHPSLPQCAGSGRRCRENREKHGDCKPKDRGKHPVNVWSTQTASPPTDGMLTLWFGGDEPRNVGIAAGPSGLLILDEDTPGALEALAAELGEEVPDTYRVLTSRGYHWYFDDPDNEFGNEAGRLEDYGIDVRGGHGHGGYVVAAGSTHRTGVQYVEVDSAATTIPTPEWVKALLRTPSKQKTEQRQAAGVGPVPEGGWNAEPRYGSPEELRAQYRRHVAEVAGLATPPGVRPNGEAFRHALFTAARDGWRLVDCELSDEQTVLDDLAEAIEAVWGAPPDDDDQHIVLEQARKKATESPWVPIQVGGGVKVQHDREGEDEEEGDRARQSLAPSWEPLDLGPYLRGEVEPVEPTTGVARRDGVRLLYPGKEHAVIGEMEAGKSWFSLACVVAELAQGRAVVYVHFEEDDPTDTLTRLRLLGATDEQLVGQFLFVAPETAITPPAVDQLVAREPSLVVLDGQNEAMALHGLGIREEDGAAGYRRLLVKPFTSAGAAVLSCDHVVKDTEKSTKGYALGSIHKGNGLNGTLILLENEDPFGRGRRGASRVYVTKDRPGQVRQHGQPTTVPRKFLLGVLSVDATDPDVLDLQFWPPRPEVVEEDSNPLFLGRKWHELLAAESAVPEEVGKLKGEGGNAARDIFRVLRYVKDPGGLTTGEVLSALREGPRHHARSSIYAARSALLKEGICVKGKTATRIALAPDYRESEGAA